MCNSHVMAIVRVYEVLFEDLIYALPQSEESLSRDRDRIRRAAVERGIHLFVVDLPSVGKLLDRSLSSGFLDLGRLPLTRTAPGSKLPIFLGSLWTRIFREDGFLHETPDVQAIKLLRQVLYMMKKLPLPFSREALAKAVRELYEDDACLPEPENFWETDSPSTCLGRVTFPGFSTSALYSERVRDLPPALQLDVSEVLRKLDLVSGLITSSLGTYNPSEWRCKHGPGAISQASGISNKYHWYGWSPGLESVYPYADYGFHSWASWAWHADDLDLGYTPRSRLVAVPKTYEKPRLIAAEPVENQWCQQNLWHYMRVRTEDSWVGNFVRFTDQSLNQSLCLQGSRSGMLATIDLSSASDRVSCHAIGNFWRGNLSVLDSLRATRTRSLIQDLTGDLPRELKLHKFSTMGSACTFPTETLLFLSIALAAVAHKRRTPITVEGLVGLTGDVAVFGDDIIVPTESRELLQATLGVMHFKVNESKSFSEGNFRESCGVDSYMGECVTPSYIKGFCTGSPESVASTVETANNFYQNFMLLTAQYLESTTPPHIATVHPDSGVFGFKSRVGISEHPIRMNQDLQREEMRILQFTGQVPVESAHDDSALHQFFTEQPDPLTQWQSGVKQRPRLKLRRRWVSRASLGK